MQKVTKALLYSALVFPGVGQVMLNQRAFGFSLIGVCAFATVILFAYVFDSALRVVEHVQTGRVAPDYATIREAVMAQQAASDSFLLNTSVLTIVVCWLLSIVHLVYRARITRT